MIVWRYGGCGDTDAAARRRWRWQNSIAVSLRSTDRPQGSARGADHRSDIAPTPAAAASRHHSRRRRRRAADELAKRAKLPSCRAAELLSHRAAELRSPPQSSTARSSSSRKRDIDEREREDGRQQRLRLSRARRRRLRGPAVAPSGKGHQVTGYAAQPTERTSSAVSASPAERSEHSRRLCAAIDKTSDQIITRLDPVHTRK